MAVTLALFAGGIVMGIAGALLWAWGVHSGQFRNLEETKEQLFWPELAPEGGDGLEPVDRGAAGEGSTR